jgi:hypothetical protein
MKASAAAVNGVLAVVGLAAAYTTWQRPKDVVREDKVVVLEASKASLQKVRFDDGSRALELTRADDGVVWLRQEVHAGALTKVATPHTVLPDGGAALPTAPDGGWSTTSDGGVKVEVTPLPPEAPPPPRVTRGNERAETLMGRFTPFEGVRALGTLAPAKEKELGLEGSTRTLTVTVSGQARAFTVGNPQTGMVGTYLKDAKDGAVYLLSGSLLSELEPSSQALVDRRLHTFRGPDFDEFVISYDAVKKAYLQKDAEIPQTMKVMAKDTPDRPDDLVRNWHDKVWNRLIVTEVLGKDESPKTGAPKVELRIEYLGRGKLKGFVELGKGTGGDLWARTENTASWVGLHMGTDDLIAEAKKFTSAPR